MKAIIVAGGKGERLRPLTARFPKAMIKVSGKPILEHIIIFLKKNGIKEIIISLCFLPDKIISYFEDGSKFGVKISYVLEEESKPLGTAGAVLGTKRFIKDTFIVTYGDILRDLDVKNMLEFHKKKKGIGTLAIYRNTNTDPKSIVKIDGEYNVLEFIERPALTDLKGKAVFSNASFYIFEPEIFDFIPKGEKSDFGRDIFPALLLNNQKISAYLSCGYFADIGDRKKLNYARKTLGI